MSDCCKQYPSDRFCRECGNVIPKAVDMAFGDLRKANIARLPLFKNRKGETAHSKSDGSDGCLAQWCNAVCGELGEAANIIKKIERGDMSLDEARQSLADELADVATYLDILAFRAGVDLGVATADKFNRVSERVGCGVRIATPRDPATPTPKPAEGKGRTRGQIISDEYTAGRNDMNYVGEQLKDNIDAEILRAVRLTINKFRWVSFARCPSEEAILELVNSPTPCPKEGE